MRILSPATNLLFAPAEFFEFSDRLQSSGAIVLVLCACLLTFVDSAVLHHELFSLVQRSLIANPYLSEASRMTVENGVASLSPVAFLAVGFSAFAWIPYWILTTVLLANTAVLVGYPYRFRDLLRSCGYAFAAFLPCLLVSTIWLLLHPVRLVPDALLTSRDMGQATAAIVGITKEFAKSSSLVLIRNLTWTAVAWYEIVVLFAFRAVYRAKWLPSITTVVLAAVLLNGGSLLVQKAIGQ